MYLYNSQDWPIFKWNSEKLLPLLSYVRNRQGKLIGKMGALGFELRNEANLEILTLDIIKSTEIEGEFLDREQVRSSIARRLGLEISGLIYSEGNVDGIVDLMVDAMKNFDKELNKERLISWHAALFPTGLWRGNNGGTGTWEEIHNIPSVNNMYSGFMAVSPLDPNHLYISTESGLFSVKEAHLSNPIIEQVDLGDDYVTSPIALDNNGNLFNFSNTNRWQSEVSGHKSLVIYDIMGEKKRWLTSLKIGVLTTWFSM